ncbi:MAG: hypothetical protein AAFV47_13250 [Pseudomonadota bacterium]
MKLGNVALWWGTLGFTALLAVGIQRMWGIALDSLDYSWSLTHYALLVVNTGMMAWVEGYRGFQQSFSPRFAARAVALQHNPSLPGTVFAPLALMGFLHAPRRRVISAVLLTLGIVAIVMIYRAFPQPWRGILDFGVIIGLTWGAVATIAAVIRAVAKGTDVDPEWLALT